MIAAICTAGSILLGGCTGNGQPAGSTQTSASSAASSITGVPETGETSDPTVPQSPSQTDVDNLKLTGRTQYRASLTIGRPASMEDLVYVRGVQSITFRNDSSDTWNDVVLREYSPAILGREVWSYNKEGRTRPYKQDEVQHTAIEKVSCDGKDLQFAEQEDRTVVRITLDTPMAPGDIRTVDLNYTLKVTSGDARQGFEQVDSSNQDDPCDAGRIVVALGPFLPTLPVYENGRWMADEYFTDGECFYTKCSDYNIELSVPEGFEVVSSGHERRVDEKTFEITAENMRDLALIAGDSLNHIDQQWNGKNIRVWYYDIGKDFYKNAADFALKTSVDAVKTFTEYYGEYAYDELDVVFAPYHNGGMEYPGMVRIQDSMCATFIIADTSSEGEDMVRLFRSGVVHEIAHQWFYSSVGNDQFNEPWLDEGLARFSELVFMEKNGYSNSAASFLDQIKASYEDTKNAPVDASASECSLNLLSASGKYPYGRTIYNGGALFLHELRGAMGTEKFEAFMKDWYSSHMNSEVTIRMFIGELLKADGSDAVRKTVDKYFREKSMP